LCFILFMWRTYCLKIGSMSVTFVSGIKFSRHHHVCISWHTSSILA
jgi:hypothetical protein